MWGLVSKLLMRALPWYPPGTPKLNSIVSMFKCDVRGILRDLLLKHTRLLALESKRSPTKLPELAKRWRIVMAEVSSSIMPVKMLTVSTWSGRRPLYLMKWSIILAVF